MSRSTVITAIDLGTDKCATLIAIINPETNQLELKGVSVVPSLGMRKSNIVDLEQVLSTINESLNAAERMAGFDIKSAYVSVSGTHITSQNSRGVIAVAAPNQEIISQDVTRVIEAARAVSLPSDSEIIHVTPRDFKVDSQEGIKDPIGMTGVRLESEAHIITGMTTALRNLEKCLHDLGLKIDSFVFSGLAASEVTLTQTEKELGVVVVDIGSGSTSVCAFVEGSLELSASLPIGARHLTQDIALGCRVSLEAAEKIKLALSDYQPLQPRPGESKKDLTARRKRGDKLDTEALGIKEKTDNLSKRTIVEGIMLPRMKEIFMMIKDLLDAKKLVPLVPAGLVISGGGAETVGISEAAKRFLNLPARVGSPPAIKGMTSDLHKPSYVVGIGLLTYGFNSGGGSAAKSGFNLNLGSIFGKINFKNPLKSIGSMLKSLMP